MTCRIAIGIKSTEQGTSINFNTPEYLQFSSSSPAIVEIESVHIVDILGNNAGQFPALAIIGDIGQSVATIPHNLIVLAPSIKAQANDQSGCGRFMINHMSDLFGKQITFKILVMSDYVNQTWTQTSSDIAVADLRYMIMLRITPINDMSLEKRSGMAPFSC